MVERSLRVPFVTLPDIRLHYQDQGPATAETTLLFVHGGLASSRWWRPALAHLPQPWRALAVDLRGSGLSRQPGCDDDERFYQVAHLAVDLAAFVEAVDLRDYFLVAHAFGGAVALDGIVRGRLTPHGLILVDTAPAMGVVTPAEAFSYLAQMHSDRGLLVKGLASVMPSRPPDAFFQQLVDDALAMPLAAFTGPARALAQWDVMGQLPSIRLPTLLIWGEHDIMVDAEATRATFLGIAGAANLEVFRGCGHSPMIEQPAGFVDSVVRFIEEDRLLPHVDDED